MGRPKKIKPIPPADSTKAGITHSNIKQRTTLNPYEELANAIIVQAAKDYEKALKKLQKRPHDVDADREATSIERFFRSKWYGSLTQADPDLIIQGLKAKVYAAQNKTSRAKKG